MRKLSTTEIGKLPANPVFKGLPKRLKDTACYADIERRMREAVHSDHTHPSVKSFVKCTRCLPKFKTRQALVKELGFKDYGQYAAWRQVMTVIISQSELSFHGDQ